MIVEPYHPGEHLDPVRLARAGVSWRAASSMRQRVLILASLTHAAQGLAPDPVWLAEWAALLARRVRVRAKMRG